MLTLRTTVSRSESSSTKWVLMPCFSKQLEHEVGHTVVDNAFADDGALLEAVERGRVIFIGNDAIIRVLRCVNFLCFALIE